jgi:hypothetical protein
VANGFLPIPDWLAWQNAGGDTRPRHSPSAARRTSSSSWLTSGQIRLVYRGGALTLAASVLQPVPGLLPPLFGGSLPSDVRPRQAMPRIEPGKAGYD